ncbi:Prolipoprotein diacylglyceryl transferase [Allomuricauda ruestringensis DSM 13258]|uniref:Phosphatidylglycerol--prolipoprotein diacylglyceryl transferase n=1 Tax=Allomuricauda ruestringensis (strain DSM 13258 / CIP 107369 / LMG 19739 / B1) TaxID=886377 RepID=G2PSS2_ALLRU|nr:prolipoprotein diacylglyceryl transferase [Allomuricauda ruestringensis]AEM69549.1 Prolipoprotein diacylglyceryl transferase [Allomuricauda ruestringensis DSM 13258]
MYFLGFDWNPEGTLFKLGFLQIKYYNLLWIAAFVLGWFIMKKIFLNEKKSMEKLDSLFIYTVVSIMLGARLGHVFFYDWDYYKDHLAEILLPIRESADSSLFGIINGYEFTGFTGLASHGATIAAIIGIWLYTRKWKDIKMLWLLDRLVVPSAIGAAFVRFGNFFNSEINGKVVDKSYFLATRFIRDSDDMPAYQAMALTKEQTPNAAYKAIQHNPKFSEILQSIPYRHPAQLYEAICYIFVFIALYLLYWKTDWKNKPGFLFGLFMVLLFVVRFFVEFYKKSQGGFEDSLGMLSTGQWLSIPMIFIGIYFMLKPPPVEL